VAYKPAHFGHFRRSAECLERGFGHRVRLVTREDLRSEIGSDLYHAGLVDESSAGLNPAGYVAGLARAAERAGVSLWPERPVQQVTENAGGYRVRTSRAELMAGNVVAATSGYAGAATPRLRRRIVPIGSYYLAWPQHPCLESVALERLAVAACPPAACFQRGGLFLH
jgi:glycine/D-amino acid oxidase-like deaminating enzyme